MKRLLSAAAALLCAVGFALPGFAQMTPVTASHLQMGGVDIPSGTVTFTLVNGIGQAVPFVTSDHKLQAPVGFTAAITNGAIAGGFTVPDQVLSVATAANTPLSEQVTVYNSSSKTGFSFTIPATAPAVTGTSGFALDQYAPAQAATVSPAGLLAVTVVPAHCAVPSKIYTLATPSVNYNCVGGVPVQETGTGGGGVTPTFAIGTVSTGAAGSSATVSLGGTAPNYTLNFSIPQGPAGTGTAGAAGVTPTFAIGTVSTGAAGSSATVTLGGTAPNYTLNFSIPQGTAGTGGGGSIALLTNGTANTSQSRLNFIAGAGVSISTASNGDMTISSSSTVASDTHVTSDGSGNVAGTSFAAAGTANGSFVSGQGTGGDVLPAAPGANKVRYTMTGNVPCYQVGASATCNLFGGSFTPVTTVASSGTTQTLAFASSGDIAYDVTLSANCTFSVSAPTNNSTFRRIYLVIRPAGFTATLPASSSSLAWAGGSAPVPSASAVTFITLGSTGVAPILGGI